MPGAPEGSCCQRCRPVLEDSSLSLALARRERLRKVALAVSQKSPAHSEIEGSWLSSPSSGSTTEDFSRDAPGTRSQRGRSVPGRAQVPALGAELS